jgi:hypothetical protein
MSTHRSVVLKAVAACALVVSACSEQSPTAPTRTAATVSPSAPSDALLPIGGILSLAAQLIATSGETPLVAQAWQAAERVQANGYNVDAIWADPIAGKGWVMYDDHLGLSAVNNINHYWITPFTWPSTTTDFTVVQHAIQSAVVEAVSGTRARTSVDDFGRSAEFGSLGGIQELVWNAAYKNDGPSNLTLAASRFVTLQGPIYTPGHTVKMVEVWVTLDRIANAAGEGEARARGTYLMSVDGKLSTHAFCFANTVDISFDFGNHVGVDAMHNAERSLGLPLDPFTQIVVVGDRVEQGTCTGTG